MVSLLFKLSYKTSSINSFQIYCFILLLCDSKTLLLRFCILDPNPRILKMKTSMEYFADSQESGRISFPSEERLKWTSVIGLLSFHPFWLSSRDHSFATPSPRGLGKVDSIPSDQGQSQGIPSMGMNDLGVDTDQSQSHQSQSLDLCFNSWEREALFWLRSLS